MDDLAQLEAELAGLRRGDDPDRWAMAVYRLALARSEVATGPDDITVALGLLDQAAKVLTAERAPLEHSRILTVAANCQRMLGRRDQAASLFEEAARLAESRTSATEVASTLVNVGLIHTEAGRPPAAITALDRAIGLLAIDGGVEPEATRLRGAALLNRAQALQAAGGGSDLDAAVSDYRQALQALEPTSAQAAMAFHGLGTALLEQHERTAAPESLTAAIDAFQETLAVFTPTTFPFQHAIARHSLAVALERRDEPGDPARALHHLEATLSVFDPRLHAAQWQTANSALLRIVEDLDDRDGPRPRMGHVAHHLAAVAAPERTTLLRERLVRLVDQPDPAVRNATETLAAALVELPLDEYRHLLPELLHVLMELPDDLLEAAAGAIGRAHSAAPDTEPRDRALDGAIHDTLFGPQRVRVRDLLESHGWTRW